MRKTIETIRDRYFLEIAESAKDQLINRYTLQLTPEMNEKVGDERRCKIEERERLDNKAKKDAEEKAKWDSRKKRESEMRDSGVKRQARASQPSTDSWKTEDSFDLDFENMVYEQVVTYHASSHPASR
ncbi:MAG: hypothetical protein Q9208_004734 [Pyrenodesmia sp. 3 TL-2023]